MIINTSRGPIVDERALIQALEQGLIQVRAGCLRERATR